MSAHEWWVTCPDHKTGPFPTRKTAEQRMDEIEEFGHCIYEHEVAYTVEPRQP